LKTNFRNKFSKNQQQISDTNQRSLYNIFSNTIANDCNQKLPVNLNSSFNFINSNQTTTLSLDTQNDSQFTKAHVGIRCNDEVTQLNDYGFNIESSFTGSTAKYESEDHEMNE